MHRRNFLLAAAAVAAAPLSRGSAKLTPKERVDHALQGADVDRPPFTLWHHFGLKTPEAHAQRTLEFHRAYRTDIVKVMSDFPYPKPPGKWYELRAMKSPFPAQIRALEMIRDGLDGSKYFIETVFNPFNVAQKLASKEDVLRMMREKPDALLAALDVITTSEIAHAKRAYATGASGVLFSVANANREELSLEDYKKFSLPFDRRFLKETAGAKLNILHLHVEPDFADLFHDFDAPIINYSLHVSGVPMAEMRRRYSQVMMGGIDEVHYRTLTIEELRAQWNAASQAAGPKFILTPGCSVPNDSQPEELSRLPKLLNA